MPKPATVGEITEYSLLVLDTNEKHKSGIDLKKLTEEEQKTVIEIQKKYEQVDIIDYTGLQ